MFSSSQVFAINGDEFEDLEKAIQLALDLSEEEIKSFKIDEDGLHLAWIKENENYTKYPFTPTAKIIVEHYKSFIKENDVYDYLEEEPDIDGSVRIGWKVFKPLWYGELKIKDYSCYDVIVIKPDWIIYAK